ncbi:hypothetical protein VP01_3971g2 [Puccinia sorghi]|uniref:Uncharacterized protein n=1 Tax=Puccinia sorghi TaxID=27349 RepID=A0A0L6UU80_9BASI|nr:hypothetical protein VP01_3971g2 [Puccinia sorghi]
MLVNAFENLSSILEDDLWLAAWLSARFTRKQQYTLTNEQLEWLKDQLIYRQNEVQNSSLALESIAQNDARNNFQNWLKDGLPFQEITDCSWRKHVNGAEALRLRNRITIYSCAAGYLQEIIKMAHHCEKKKDTNIRVGVGMMVQDSDRGRLTSFIWNTTCHSTAVRGRQLCQLIQVCNTRVCSTNHQKAILHNFPQFA